MFEEIEVVFKEPTETAGKETPSKEAKIECKGKILYHCGKIVDKVNEENQIKIFVKEAEKGYETDINSLHVTRFSQLQFNYKILTLLF
tara:strand:- start:36 stop:299 length:264 start_codon:yes stop_codon:yes gene_type:complete